MIRPKTATTQGLLFQRKLFVGPAGSGKSYQVLDLYLELWRAGRAASTLLVVPTISFREHTRNTLLRMNFAATLEGRGVVTFDELMGPPPTFSAVRRKLLVRRILAEANLPYFRDVAQFPGFREMLADEAEEVITAGLAADDLQRRLRPDKPRGQAFLEFLHRYERATAEFRRPPETVTAAADLEVLLVDGFTDFTFAQRQLLDRLANRARQVVVTLPDSSDDARSKLIAGMGFVEQRLEGNHRGQPEVARVACEDRRGEIDLLAREILDLVQHRGYHYSEIGVIVQRPDTYLHTLAAVLRGLDIPARFFFPVSAADTSLGRQLLACLQIFRNQDADRRAAMLDVLKSAWTPAINREAVARLEFCWAEGKRNGQLVPGFTETIERLDATSKQAKTPAAMAQWLLNVWEALTAIRELPVATDHAQALDLRADALTRRRAWDLPAEVAAAVRAENASLDLAEFLTLVDEELRGLRFRVRDRRTDAVNVMNAYEARQWELRAVFVLGLVEGEFPRPPHAPLFLSDAERLATGLPGAMAEQREQLHLYNVAITRARERLTITWPRADGRGGELTPSRFLERPLPNFEFVPRSAPSGRREEKDARLTLPAVLNPVRATDTFSASGFRNFAQCPFKYFAGHALRLQGRPKQERGLTSSLAGTIVHETICAWQKDGCREDIAAVFGRIFERARVGIDYGHATEKMRARMLEDLHNFVQFEAERARIYRTEVDPQFLEYPFEAPLQLNDGTLVRITGRIDRVETRELSTGKLGLAVDLKYRSKVYTDKMFREARDGEEYQIPVYLMALESLGFLPAGIEFHNLRAPVRRAGVLEESLAAEALTGKKHRATKLVAIRDLVQIGKDNMKAQAAAIREGRISVQPTNTDHCKKNAYGCEYFDLCRIPKWKL